MSTRLSDWDKVFRKVVATDAGVELPSDMETMDQWLAMSGGGGGGSGTVQSVNGVGPDAVPYTHLTLPTISRV